MDRRGFDSAELEVAMSFTVSRFFKASLSNNGLRVSFDGFTDFVEAGAAFQGSEFTNGSETVPTETATVSVEMLT